MGAAGAIMPIMQMGMSAAGGGKGGGGGGGGGGGQGVTPQEAALAQYTMQQGELGAVSEGAKFGTPVSTMTTQMGTGPRLQKALQLAGMSDKNQATIGALAQQQAQQQGAAAGEAASGFSGSSGNFGQSTDSTSPTDATSAG